MIRVTDVKLLMEGRQNRLPYLFRGVLIPELQRILKPVFGYNETSLNVFSSDTTTRS